MFLVGSMNLIIRNKMKLWTTMVFACSRKLKKLFVSVYLTFDTYLMIVAQCNSSVAIKSVAVGS